MKILPISFLNKQFQVWVVSKRYSTLLSTKCTKKYDAQISEIYIYAEIVYERKAMR